MKRTFLCGGIRKCGSKELSSLRIELNIAGIRQLRKSPEVVAELERHADATMAGLPSGDYEKSTYLGRNRANVSVSTKTNSAKKDNMKNNSLLKALK